MVRVLIVGGGIGGLTAAIALARHGIASTVLERAPGMREIGAGITLWSNALRALRRLGLEDPVVRAGAVLQGGDVATRHGRLLFSADIARLAAEIGAPSVALPRAALQRVLLEALPPGTLRVGAAVEGVREEADGVAAVLEDGSEERGDVLVGADGIGSVVRRHLHGEETPRYAGYTCWRAILEASGPWLPEGRAREVWGPGLRFGAVPLGEGRLYWFASRNAPEGEAFDAGADLLRLREAARGWASPVPEVLAALRPDLLLRHDIRDRKPLDAWGRGRVTLLGDAAHPMTPNLGQGACAAIEDALVLADRLAACRRSRLLRPPILSLRASSLASVSAPSRRDHSDRLQGESGEVETALRQYEAQRAPRTALLVRKARFLGRVGQEASPVLGSLRNVLMRLRPAWSYRREMRSFVDYDTEHP